ncbi:MAG: hypothetical protein DRH30_05430 [Deltaproteobacteria bacterium]|nr:MAG: hypothetical protein DRH30_05430 [Deltaproteobacteria bacterium]
MKTRIKCCDGKFHSITSGKDGRVISSGCGDVTDKAAEVASAVDNDAVPHDCAGLAALMLHGVPALYAQPHLEDDEDVPMMGWGDLYARFGENSAVQSVIRRERTAARKRRASVAATVTKATTTGVDLRLIPGGA